MSLEFRTEITTFVCGPAVDAWQARQEGLELAADERDQIRWWTAYRLLGGTEKLPRPSRAIPMEWLS